MTNAPTRGADLVEKKRCAREKRLVRSRRTEMNEQGFVLEGWVLYVSIVVPVLAGI
jgi:hypothetical protein